MKRTFSSSSLFSLLMIVATCLLMSSCGPKTKTEKLLRGIPADTEIVAVGNLRTVIESAGGEIKDSQIVLPQSLEDMLSTQDSGEFDELNDLLKGSGIDTDVIAVAGNTKDSYPYFVILLSDRKKFVKTLTDNEFEKDSNEGDIEIYSKQPDSGYDISHYVGIAGNYAYIYLDVWENGYDAPKALRKIISDLKDDGVYSKKIASYIGEGNAGGIAINCSKTIRKEMREEGMPTSISSMFDGYICIKGDLKNDKASVAVKMFDEDGNPKTNEDFGNWADLGARINKKALSFMAPDETFVMATSLKDVKWNKISDFMSEMMSRQEQAAMSTALGYLKKIDGTVAMGFGFTNGLESIVAIDYNNNILDNISFTIVAETKEGNNSSLLDELKTLLSTTQTPFESDKNSIIITIPGEGTIRFQTDGNFLILANHEIKGKNDNPTVKSLKFDDYMSACGLVMLPSNKLVKDLHINNEIMMEIHSDAKESEAVFTAEIKGGKGEGFIAKVIGMVTDIMSHEKQIEGQMQDAGRAYQKRYSYEEPVISSAEPDYLY